MQFDVDEAQAYARSGRIGEWVHAYLETGSWANPGLSNGLRLQQRWWVGPVSVGIDTPIRVEGPEAEMEYVVPAHLWALKLSQLAAGFTDVMAVPPLIVENRSGFLSVRDGNHRLAAMRQKGWPECWVLIWYNTEAEYLSSPYRSR